MLCRGMYRRAEKEREREFSNVEREERELHIIEKRDNQVR